MNEGDLYADREQTLVKHFILEHYLERFAHIVGSAWDAITYVDCFAGPWNARSEHLEDSSFALGCVACRAETARPQAHGEQACRASGIAGGFDSRAAK
ncbi:MAG: hypothetical protein JETCAE02_28700 [Anaerolineaceae bacterium]|nr:MAG: hypothetical protein JETCAE02_28700 [Anaerolineaceae bacterium]